MDITTITSFHFDPEFMNWIKSDREFTWDDIYVRQEGQFFSKDKYSVDTMVETGRSQVLLIFFYIFLTWYFDNVIPLNRGVPKPWNFLFMPKFWFPSLFSQESGKKVSDYPVLEQTTSVNSEQDQILKLEKEGKFKVNGIRCLGLSKTFKSILADVEIKALQSVYF